MATTSKRSTATRKKSPQKKSRKQNAAPQKRYQRLLARPTRRLHAFLLRRPHRSLRRTRRRDYVRTLKMPGYISFTRHVAITLWQHRGTFLLLAILYALLNALLVGLGSQDTYTQLATTLKETGGNLFSGGFGQIGQSSLLLVAAIGGGLNSTSATDAQKIFGFLLALMLWLTVVWLLRAYLVGNRPRLRDGLYSSSSPLLAMLVVAIVGVVQLIPIAVAVVGFTAASAYGLFDGGLPAMLFWITATLLTCLSLYWITSTFIAMVVVTLPGMYPWQAVKTAGDLVIGRRVRVLLRLLWMALLIVIAWAIVMVPIVLLSNWLTSIWKQIAWLPIVPFCLLIMSTLTLIWVSGYVYLLYRRIVDDEAKPA